MEKKKSHVRKRHRFWFFVLRPVGWAIALIYRFKYKVFRIKKGENYLILANHQTLLDPALLCISFNAPIYLMATDTILRNNIPSRLLRYCFAPIAKKKGAVDVSSVMNCMRVARAGGNIAIFPEGNRAWADFQFYITPSIVKMIRMINLPLIIYNFEGGYGVDPRWGAKLRKGRFRGYVRSVISVDEIKAMSDEDLSKKVISELRVIDSESGNKYKSNRRAEYLERELFVCPKCNSVSTLHSHGNFVKCENCSLEVEYTEELTLKSNDGNFEFKKLVDWYEYQLKFVESYIACEGEIIYSDENVVMNDITEKNTVKLGEGMLMLDSDKLVVGDFEVKLSDITGASVVGGRKLSVNTADRSYTVVGDSRFNALKYVLTFNILKTGIKEEKYYALSI